jgi:uncharacterized protein with ParB-like and HNH nuclease domain
MAIGQPKYITIWQLFQESKQFVIPKFQRSYSWESKEVIAFCDDIFNIISNEKKYFLGGIVLVRKSINLDGKQENVDIVVDGQQRITTISILASQILKKLKKYQAEFHGHPEYHEAYDECIKLEYEIMSNLMNHNNFEVFRKEPKRKLHLTMLDDEFYEKTVYRGQNVDSDTESHKRIIKAQEIIQSELIGKVIRNLGEEPTSKEKVIALSSILAALSELLFIIKIPTDSQEDAYQLFEVLNDRGKNLAVGDFLRSFTLESIYNIEGESNKFNEISNYWDNILSVDYADQFLATYLKSYIGNKTLSTRLHDVFEKKFFNLPIGDINSLYERMKNVHKCLEVYDSIKNGKWPVEIEEGIIGDWETQRLRFLMEKLDHKLAIPFLMTLVDISIDQRIFARVIHDIELFYLKYIYIASKSASKLSNLYTEQILKIRRKEEFDIEFFESKLQNLLDENVSILLFSEQFNKIEYQKNGSKKNRKIMCLLNNLEHYWKAYSENKNNKPYNPDKSYTYDIRKNDIEHVYPQSPKDRIQDLEMVKNKIGNLTFYRYEDNRAAQNDPFVEKKEKYIDSQVKMTNAIAEFNEWRPDEFHIRTKDLIERAYNILNLTNAQFVEYKNSVD